MNQKTPILAAALFVVAIVCAGCAGQLASGVLTSAAKIANFGGTSSVTILAATTRQRSNIPGVMFNGLRAKEVSYASITVSIPPDSKRNVGEIQWPPKLPGNPQQSFVTTAANDISQQAFIDAITAETKLNNRNKVLVFVHGFNNRFEDAVYRFSQIVHDAQAPGIPVMFSWPSRGEINLRAYTYDRESATYSRDALVNLIDQIASIPRVAEINIVAHSMGNWVTMEALRTMAVSKKQIPRKLRNVLLVAPDVDVNVFRTQMHDIMLAKKANPWPRISVFVSQDDKALALSRTIWGGVPRLGDINPATEPYRSEFAQDDIEAFNLTDLKSGGSAHDRAFEDVTTVVMLMRRRFDGEQKGAAH